MRPAALPETASARVPQRAGAPSGFSVDGTGMKSAEAAANANKPAGTPESYKRFEAMVLQTFVQNMLPREGSAVYGKGMAGDMWKSMMAEQIAGVMAERGGIGIADKMLGGQYDARAKSPESTAPAAQMPETAQAKPAGRFSPVAPAVIDAMQRSLSGLIADEPAARAETTVQSTTKRG